MCSRADVDVGSGRLQRRQFFGFEVEGPGKPFGVAAAELEGERGSHGADHRLGEALVELAEELVAEREGDAEFADSGEHLAEAEAEVVELVDDDMERRPIVGTLQRGGVKRRDQECADQRGFLDAEFALREASDEDFLAVHHLAKRNP